MLTLDRVRAWVVPRLSSCQRRYGGRLSAGACRPQWVEGLGSFFSLPSPKVTGPVLLCKPVWRGASSLLSGSHKRGSMILIWG